MYLTISAGAVSEGRSAINSLRAQMQMITMNTKSSEAQNINLE
jgi:hypothetical protein